MGFWNKVKDLVGIEDDYYDEDEYYDDYEDEYSDNHDKDNDEVNENKEEKSNREERRYNSYDTTKLDNKEYNVNTSSQKRNYSSNKNMQVTIKEPLTYEDGKSVLDDILQGKTVVLNLEMLEMDKKTQIFYFVSGGLYSLKGSLSEVTKDIYVLVPEGVQLDGKLSKTIADKTLYQI